MSKIIYLVTGRDPVTIGSNVLGAFEDEDTANAAADIFSENDTSVQDITVSPVSFYGDEVPLLKSMYLLRAAGATGIIDMVAMPEDTKDDYNASTMTDEDGNETTVLYALSDMRDSLDKVVKEISGTLELQGVEFNLIDNTEES